MRLIKKSFLCRGSFENTKKIKEKDTLCSFVFFTDKLHFINTFKAYLTVSLNTLQADIIVLVKHVLEYF